MIFKMENNICLIMIVKDESHIIERCLGSVVNIITSYLICDTGSTDNTVEIIKKFMKANNIPGEVIHKEWKNFAFNKSYLLEKAYKDNMSKDARYLVWLDADEVLLNENDQGLTPEDNKKLLQFLQDNSDAGIFYFMTHYEDLRYWRWNLVKNDQLFRWECPVHEYLVESKETKMARISFVKLLARKEGNRTREGNSSKKDIKMFKDYIKEKPSEPRAVFYLAQTYQDADNIKKAIEYYKTRIAMVAGYQQERYMASLRLGRIYKSKERKEKAIKIWKEGRIIAPKRLEIPFEIMMSLDSKKDAYALGSKAYEKHCKSDEDLFIENNIYDWKFLMELSVAAYYAEEYKTAYKLGKKLLDEGKYPECVSGTVEQNMKFYKDKIGVSNDDILSLETNLILPAVVIIDNFLKNPDKVREFALSKEFTVKGNYPGIRTESFATLDHKCIFEKILGCKISYWPTEYNGSFQVTTEENKSWIHRDLTDFSALLYLTPDPPPKGGTLTYRHIKHGIERDKEATEEQTKEMNDDSNDGDKWEVMDTVANKYNRLVVFTGRRSHKSNEYFGNNRSNGRLFQIFFFDVEGYA